METFWQYKEKNDQTRSLLTKPITPFKIANLKSVLRWNLPILYNNERMEDVLHDFEDPSIVF